MLLNEQLDVTKAKLISSSPVRHQQHIQHKLEQQVHCLWPLSQVKGRSILGSVCRIFHMVKCGDQQVHQAKRRRRMGGKKKRNEAKSCIILCVSNV